MLNGNDPVTVPESNLFKKKKETFSRTIFMGMSTRRVVALTDEHVVLCYARPDGGGCQATIKIPRQQLSSERSIPSMIGDAEMIEKKNQMLNVGDQGSISNQSKKRMDVSVTDSLFDESVWDSNQFPEQPFHDAAWGSKQLFTDVVVVRVEVERLDHDRSVVCFERSIDRGGGGGVACIVGYIEGDALLPFGTPLELRSPKARLVSVSVLWGYS